MTAVDDAGATPLTLNVTRSLKYGGERWWKILCMVVATLRIIRNELHCIVSFAVSHVICGLWDGDGSRSRGPMQVCVRHTSIHCDVL